MFKEVLIFGVLFGCGLGDDEKAGCPPFFENILEKCYFFSTTMGGDAKTWHGARDYCHALSTDFDTELAVMGNSCAEDEAFLSAIASKGITTAWVGASDVVQQGTWSWLDGRTLDLSSHSWHPNRPSTSSVTNCAQVENFSAKGRMYLVDQYCESYSQYICETNVITFNKD